jgi:hypothetical protein
MTPANEAARRNSQARRPTVDNALAVYDGQQRVGTVVERNGKFLAVDVHDRRVGVFTKQSDAARALPAARWSVAIERSFAARHDVETT